MERYLGKFRASLDKRIERVSQFRLVVPGHQRASVKARLLVAAGGCDQVMGVLGPGEIDLFPHVRSKA